MGLPGYVSLIMLLPKNSYGKFADIWTKNSRGGISPHMCPKLRLRLGAGTSSLRTVGSTVMSRWDTAGSGSQMAPYGGHWPTP